jgi:superfamily II DNA or RNA helicase/HKD family nuclease
MEKNRFITNNNYLFDSNLYNNLKECLEFAKSFIFSVAFINFAGVQIILELLANCERKNIKGKILTTNYLHFTELKSVEYLKKFKNIEVKFFDSDELGGFHTKGYIFEFETHYKTIIGSSNLTKGGLKKNIEWNTLSVLEKDSPYMKDILLEFNFLWQKAVEKVPYYEPISKNIKRKDYSFSNFLEENKNVADTELSFFTQRVEPNYMQKTALENLYKIRLYNEKRALCISATGTGKTYLGAFDVRNYNPKTLLFIVHNEEILNSAMETFKKVLPEKNYGKFTGAIKNRKSNYIFSTIQSMNKYFLEFKRDYFEYIIVDEAHHITSPSYQAVLEYFQPKFLLGLTATPERCDGGNIYEVFNMNIPVEIRLQEALERNLIVPFHYYGIKDIDDIDLKDIKLTEIRKLTKLLNLSKRVDFIIEKMNFYGYSGEKRKGLGFCISIEQCEYMAKEFTERGIKAIAITGNTNPEVRKEILKKFEYDDIEIIFVVDIFNEGVDIPCINTILMLRPTNSPIIFTQQLGRGLRHFKEKEFLTVIDFIGNHNKTFLIAIALMGRKGYDKESLKLSVKNDFNNLSKNLHISLDKICKEEIIKQLDNENFNSIKYLKEEYENFKDFLKRVPTPMDYINFDEAPELFRYINKSKSYFEFLKYVKDNSFELTQQEINIIREIESYLPIKRIYEFLIIHNLISKEENSLSINSIISLLARFIFIENLERCKSSIEHSMRYLNGEFFDSVELKKSNNLFKFKNGIISKSEEFTSLLKNENLKNYLLEILDYGLLRYKKEFSNKDYGMPFFKLYSTYNMKDVALLCNYEKKHSAFRGSGLLKNGKEYFIFIDLHKEKDIKESINYKDKILSRELIQWQSQNSTAQISEIGKNITDNINRGINLHMFVRKFKEVDGIIQSYLYIGKGNCIEFEGNKPITLKLKLDNILPKEIFIELTERVESNYQFNSNILEVADEKYS